MATEIQPTMTQQNQQPSNIKGSDSETSLHLEHISTLPQPNKDPDPNSWPTTSPNDPRNWPKWKKNAQIIMVAFHSMASTFMAAGIIPAYEVFAEEYGVTTPRASYLTSIQILLLGICPIFWKPLTSQYGRYHVLLFSVLGSMVCNIGGARCTSYGAQMATRVLTAVLISPPVGIGSGVITELCDPGERAQKLGWWTLMITMGTPGGPFIMGFVTKHAGVQWIFWVFAIMNFGQFVCYLFFGDETMYNPENDAESKGSISQKSIFGKLIPRRINPRPIQLTEFLEPFSMARHPKVLIAAAAHSIVFCYANIALIVEMPIVFGEKFHFDPQQIGLQFIAIIIGCTLGEQVSGPISDWFMKTMQTRRGHTNPADRLWLSYIGYATVYAGLLTWGFQLQKAEGSWNVTPNVGAAIASFGNQVLMTILISFAVDCYKEKATQVGLFVNIFRHVYGFIGPFYFPPMFTALGLGTAAGVMLAIIGGCALIPTIAIQIASRSRHD